MWHFRLTALAVAVVVFGSAGVGAVQQHDKEAAAKELKQLQGTWKQVSIESNGQKEGFAKGTSPHLTIRGDRYTVEAGGKVLESGVWKVDPAAKPGSFDLVATGGTTKGKTYLGIYEIVGDELRMCIARTGVNRPTDFTAKSGSGRALSVYRRVPPPK